MNEISSLINALETKEAIIQNNKKINLLQETVHQGEIQRLRRLHKTELQYSKQLLKNFRKTNRHLEQTVLERDIIVHQLEDDINKHKDARTELEAVIEHLIDTRPKRKTPPTEPIKRYNKTYIRDSSHKEETRKGTKWHVQEIGGVWNYTNYSSPPKEQLNLSDIDSLLGDPFFDDIFVDQELDDISDLSDDNLDFLYD